MVELAAKSKVNAATTGTIVAILLVCIFISPFIAHSVGFRFVLSRFIFGFA